MPTEEFEILDTWHVTAMMATSSHDVMLNDVFVSDYHGIPIEVLCERALLGWIFVWNYFGASPSKFHVLWSRWSHV